MGTPIYNVESLSQLDADQPVDMGTIKDACKASVDRCVALADQMTILSRECHSRHQELQSSVSASLNVLDYRTGVSEAAGGDAPVNAAAPALQAK
eukprot:2086298-Pyramimonas_sp.AAC.1